MSVEGCLGGSVLCVCVCAVQNTAGTESHYSKALQTKNIMSSNQFIQVIKTF